MHQSNRMLDDCAELRRLNRDTFRAEAGGTVQIDGKGWRQFLDTVLADEFQICRAIPGTPQQRQGKEAMLAWIEAHPSAGEPREIIAQHEVAWCDENLGVVTSPIAFMRKEYQNVKIFKKSPRGQWQCIYWQVTQLAAQACPQ